MGLSGKGGWDQKSQDDQRGSVCQSECNRMPWGASEEFEEESLGRLNEWHRLYRIVTRVKGAGGDAAALLCQH
jgi:hypothetical protein